MEFSVSERYRLELHWNKARYDVDQEAVLDGCYFSGPVLSEVWQLEQEDHIDLDFAGQYIIFVDFYYIARLSWKGVKHTPEKIFLSNVVLKNSNLNVVPKVNDNDYIAHRYNLVYPSYLLRSDGTLYDFGSMK
jgi:hypothetical protein